VEPKEENGPNGQAVQGDQDRDGWGNRGSAAAMAGHCDLDETNLRSVSRPSNPTRPSESVSESSSSRTERRSPLSSPTTVVSTSPMRTTRS